MLLERFYDTIVHFLHLLLIAGRATAKEIDIARSYIAKGSGVDDNIGCYWSSLHIQKYLDTIFQLDWLCQAAVYQIYTIHSISISAFRGKEVTSMELVYKLFNMSKKCRQALF